jgi:hypothetical protein
MEATRFTYLLNVEKDDPPKSTVELCYNIMKETEYSIFLSL